MRPARFEGQPQRLARRRAGAAGRSPRRACAGAARSASGASASTRKRRRALPDHRLADGADSIWLTRPHWSARRRPAGGVKLKALGGQRRVASRRPRTSSSERWPKASSDFDRRQRSPAKADRSVWNAAVLALRASPRPIAGRLRRGRHAFSVKSCSSRRCRPATRPASRRAPAQTGRTVTCLRSGRRSRPSGRRRRSAARRAWHRQSGSGRAARTRSCRSSLRCFAPSGDGRRSA